LSCELVAIYAISFIVNSCLILLIGIQTFDVIRIKNYSLNPKNPLVNLADGTVTHWLGMA
jgi:hypothetical protein